MAGVRRVAVLVLVATLLASSLVHYGAVGDRHDLVQSSTAKLDHYDRHIGETVYLWGKVTEVGTGGTVVTVEEQRLTVHGVTGDPDPGDVIQIYGTLRPEGVVEAERTVLSVGERRLPLYVVSAIGLLLALVVVARRWRLDRESWTVRPREGDDA